MASDLSKNQALCLFGILVAMALTAIGIVVWTICVFIYNNSIKDILGATILVICTLRIITYVIQCCKQDTRPIPYSDEPFRSPTDLARERALERKKRKLELQQH
jgi:low affinity Fe/Cu permease